MCPPPSISSQALRCSSFSLPRAQGRSRPAPLPGWFLPCSTREREIVGLFDAIFSSSNMKRSEYWSEVMPLIPQAAAAPPPFEFAFQNPRFLDTLLQLEIVAADTTLVVSRKRAHDEDGASAGVETNSKKQQLSDRREEPSEKQRNESPEKTADGTSVLPGQKSTEQQTSQVDDMVLQEEGETELARNELRNVATESEPAKDIPSVKEIWVNSAIVASESPYFLKLFGNGMKESGQNIVPMRVTKIEAEALEELIHYIYKEKFKRTDPQHLLNILIASDKYQVKKAIKFCIESMLNSEITTESAFLYLNCPVALEAMEAVKIAASDFLVKNFYQVARNEQALLKMPISAIRAIFGSSELVVLNEDYVFDFLSKWVCQRYPDLNRRSLLFSRVLVNLIRFPHMSVKGLSMIGTCPLMTNKTQVIFIITNALLYKSNTSHRPVSQWNYHQRFYLMRPIKVTALDPIAEILAYMDIDLQHLLAMKPGNTTIDSESFMLAGFRFTMRADTKFDAASDPPTSVGLFLMVHEFTRQPVNAHVSFAVRRPADDFITTFQFSSSLASGSKLGHEDGFKCPWAQLTGEESPFVIGGKIFIRVRVRALP